MVISYWTHLNPTVKITKTRKKFYGKFLYKAVFHCPGISVIRNPKLQWDSRLAWNRLYHESGKKKQITFYYELIEKFAGELTSRIEGPYLHIYTNDTSIIKEFCNYYTDRVFEVSEPESEQALALLKDDVILTRKMPEYQFKIMLREGFFDNKQEVANYLYNLERDDIVCLTKSTIKYLNNHGKWFPGGYFYTRDDSVVTFISLVAPNLIKKVFKIEQIKE